MWDRLIKLNPYLIKYYNKKGLNKGNSEEIIKIALDNGYQIREIDLKNNIALQSSDLIMSKAIEINPNYIKYYHGNSNKMIEKAVNRGYIPNIEDLKENINLRKFSLLINYLIENNHPKAIKYYRGNDKQLFKLAIEKGYIPNEEDLKHNLRLASNKIIMTYAIEKNPYLIRFFKYKYASIIDEDDNLKLINLALKKGYIPKIDDLINNRDLGKSEELIRYLIENNHPEAIKYYQGEMKQLFKLAIEKGFIPKIEDLQSSYSYLAFSDDIMELLIKENSDVIMQYIGSNEKIYELAYNLGFTEKKIMKAIKHKELNYQRLKNKYYMKKIFDYDINFFKKYMCDSLMTAVEVGYIPSLEEIQNISNSYTRDRLLEHVILNEPSYIKYYNGIDEKVYLYALEHGYLPNEETIEKGYIFANNLDVITKIIKLKPEYIKYFTGMELTLKILALNYIPTILELNNDNYARSTIQVIKKLININPRYIECSLIYDLGEFEKLYIEAIHLGYRPSIDMINQDFILRTNYSITYELVKCDLKYISLAGHFSQQVAGKLYDLAFNLGYRPDGSISLSQLSYSDKIMKYFINYNYNNIEEYNGMNIDIFKLALEKGYKVLPLKAIIDPNTSYRKRDVNIILYLLNNKDFSIFSKLDFYSERVMKVALLLGYIPKIDTINNYNYNKDLFDDSLLKKILSNSTIEECLSFIGRVSSISEEIVHYIEKIFIVHEYIPPLSKLNNYSYRFFSEDFFKKIVSKSSKEDCIKFFEQVDNISQEVVEYILKQKLMNLPLDYLEILKDYQYNKIKFLNNYNLYISFLNKMKIEESVFIQYVFNVDFDWLNSMLYIINNDKMDEFIKINDYFLKNYYIKQGSNSEVFKMKSFINMLMNYAKYPDLCLNIKNSLVELSEEMISSIKFLFSNNVELDKTIKPKTLDDFYNIKNIIKNKYVNDLNNIDINKIDEVKNVLCKLLFNMDLKNVNRKLKIYGDTKVLRQLIFNNRNNNEIIDRITEMMIYTSMMEAIIYCNNNDYLNDMLKNILNNYELSTNCMFLFNEFDQKMRKLYEDELITNLTHLNNNCDNLLDQEMSEKYGVDVVDFTDKKYCLAYHVKSYTESYEELVKGISSRNKNTISLSVGSNRNQVLYRYGNIIFATDEIPSGAFIRSSTSNMGSNGTIKKGSFEDKGINQTREQRGALETSTAPKDYNSEVLCFRAGIKFKYIILPGGREPKYEEVEIAKEYGLKFIKTQELNKSINNPQEINSEYLKTSKSYNCDIQNLKELKKQLLKQKEFPRKIAIFTDSHALFEPTLAILEDARKSGITEIYSLGDNIGTGPNPKEVMELLSEYGVKSLKGNHEIYATVGIDELKEHLESDYAYNEAKNNSSWTRNQLTQEQISEISNNPEKIIIEIGGQKILLTHYINDYKTGKKKEIPEGISQVFQGHIHFEKKSLNGIVTLRGAGIGQNGSDVGKAYYIVLTERTDGGYDIETKIIPYDINNLRHDIYESSMDFHDKDKIESWVGIKR